MTTLEEIIKIAEETLLSFPEGLKKEIIKTIEVAYKSGKQENADISYNAGFAEGVKRAGQVQDFTLGKIFGEAKG